MINCYRLIPIDDYRYVFLGLDILQIYRHYKFDYIVDNNTTIIELGQKLKHILKTEKIIK